MEAATQPNASRWTSARRQSALVVWLTAPALTLLFAGLLPRVPLTTGLACATTGLLLALVVWRLRAATPPAALAGGLITVLLCGPAHALGLSPSTSSALLHSALPGLLLLFILTFGATKVAARAKRRLHPEAPRTRESRRGRQTSQVLANLGPAGLAAGLLPWLPQAWVLSAAAALFACLAESTADTVSSEIGAAFGGTPVLLTTLRRVPPGTDGGISLLGTAAGVGASFPVAACALCLPGVGFNLVLTAWIAGIFGLFLDSLLGATWERHGLLTNDPVNLLSTAASAAFAAAAAHALLR